MVATAGPNLAPVAQVRVLHADTDAMGMVYHGAYLRWMEHARVELIRARGLSYAAMEAEGLGLPVTALTLRYRAPGRHDDLVTLQVGISRRGRAGLSFVYRLVVAPGGRAGALEPILLAEGETHHACVRMADGRPVRLPARLVDLLSS